MGDFLGRKVVFLKLFFRAAADKIRILSERGGRPPVHLSLRSSNGLLKLTLVSIAQCYACESNRILGTL